MVALADRVDHVECAHALEAGRARTAAAGRARAAVQPPIEVPAPLVVGGADRRGVSAAVGGAHTAGTTARSGRSGRAPTPSRRPTCWPGSPACAPAPPGWRGRRCTGRPAPNASCRRARRARGVAGRRIRRRRRGAPTALIDGLEDDALAAVLARIGELAERDRYETAARLRDHAAAAIDALWRGQRLRALASVAELVGGPPRRRRRLASRGDPARPAGRGGRRAPRRAADAGRRRDVRCRTSDSAVRRPRWAARSSRRTALVMRWLAQPGVRIVRAEPGWASPLGSAGRWASWAATARSARLAAAAERLDVVRAAE